MKKKLDYKIGNIGVFQICGKKYIREIYQREEDQSVFICLENDDMIWYLGSGSILYTDHTFLGYKTKHFDI